MTEALKPAMSRRAVGIVEILLSGFFFGFLGVFGKSALGKGIAPFEFLSFRYLVAAGLMALLVAFRTKSFSALWPRPRIILISLALGVVGYAVFSSFYFLALERISASMTVILLYTYPVLVAAGGAVFFRERMPLSRLPALPMAFAGLVCLVWLDMQMGQATGLILGLLSALFYSAYILLSSHFVKNEDPMVSTFWIQLGAGLTLLALSFTSTNRSIEVFRLAWMEIVLIALICSVLAMWLFLSGLLKVQNWEAALLSMAEPITGVLLGVLVLGDRLTFLQSIGAGLVLAALALVSLPQRSSGSTDNI